MVHIRSTPLCHVPEMCKGNQPTDGGNLLFATQVERDEFLAKEPNAEKFIRPFVGSDEFINGTTRWCLWLKDASPQELRTMPHVLERVERVRKMRLASTKEATRKKAAIATLFDEIRQPESSFVAVPEVSSERRLYIPIGFLPSTIIVSNKIQIIPNATLFDFGVLTSAMHMAWVRVVTGRLKSDYQYSSSIVYNNFPWAESPTAAQKQAVERAAQAVLDARALYLSPQPSLLPEGEGVRRTDEGKSSSLADLYDPLSMPPVLVKAHQDLDRAVDKCYRQKALSTEQERITFLFELYERYTAPLTAEAEQAAAKADGKKRGKKGD